MEKIHMIGYDAVHPSDFIYDVPAFHDRYLLILTNTPARFWLEDGAQVFPPHQAALFPPGARFRYGACDGPYGNDWIIFSSDETYVTQFPLTCAPFPVLDPEYCHSLFQLLTWEHTQGGYETVISQLMSVLFTKLEADIRQADSGDYAPALLGLRKNIMIHPQQDWSVSKMAEQLHISAGYLQLLYKRRFGVSCMDDVIRGRLRLAKDYLRHTRMNISEIAAMCGYNSAEHFSRQFHKLCGEAPGSYRRRSAGDARASDPAGV